MENKQNVLTVVVLDNKSQPTKGARVSIKPSNASEVTNDKGEVLFQLGNETKYDVTASYGSKTVTVPYYVTKNGATRLVVNPTYVRTIEKQLNQFSFLNSDLFTYLGIGFGLIILFFVFKKIIRAKSKKKK